MAGTGCEDGEGLWVMAEKLSGRELTGGKRGPDLAISELGGRL
jgi:hypothetical protein